MQQTMYQQVLNECFLDLPDTLRAMHGALGVAVWAGSANIIRGNHPLAKLCALVAELPPAMQDAPTRIKIIADAQHEIWQRNFGGAKMQSTLRCRNGLLHEALGPVHFRFHLHVDNGAILWVVHSVRLLGLLPLPAQLFSGVHCREHEEKGRYHFLVEAKLPIIGLLIRYEGWLERA